MKKWQNLVAVCAMSVSVLAGCSSTSSDAADSNGEAGAADGAKGSVYYLNFKPEQDEAWQNLAKNIQKKQELTLKS